MYREDKTAQMAAAMLKRSGGRINLIHLMKMLYLADKQMLVERGMPITYDAWGSMEHGPVLSNTLDLIRADGEQPSYWSKHITTDGKNVVLKADPGDGYLSPAEDAIIGRIFVQWGHRELEMSTNERAALNDPGQSSSPISYAEVLKIEGFSQEDAAAILDNIEAQDVLSVLLKTA